MLNEQQERWAQKRRQGVSGKKLREILVNQGGKCALSGAEMVFDTSEGTPQAGGRGCHPLYPAVDHVDPGNRDGRVQIVCYALNDLKGHLPTDCFEALIETVAWRSLTQRWREQAERDPMDREAFGRLIRPNATPKRQRRQDTSDDRL